MLHVPGFGQVSRVNRGTASRRHRAVTEPIDPFAVALSVTRALDALGVPHTIGGSIASSFAGVAGSE